jgi:hypothetical protein
MDGPVNRRAHAAKVELALALTFCVTANMKTDKSDIELITKSFARSDLRSENRELTGIKKLQMLALTPVG